VKKVRHEHNFDVEEVTDWFVAELLWFVDLAPDLLDNPKEMFFCFSAILFSFAEVSRDKDQLLATLLSEKLKVCRENVLKQAITKSIVAIKVFSPKVVHKNICMVDCEG